MSQALSPVGHTGATPWWSRPPLPLLLPPASVGRLEAARLRRSEAGGAVRRNTREGLKGAGVGSEEPSGVSR